MMAGCLLPAFILENTPMLFEIARNCEVSICFLHPPDAHNAKILIPHLLQLSSIPVVPFASLIPTLKMTPSQSGSHDKEEERQSH